ncbi:tail fiber domain-containing protein [Segatella sp.]|uniref:tail fiber domain-containing protein n=1 Tax=Segatella sp. TaxID=2974253 RepID=UPI003AAD9EA4
MAEIKIISRVIPRGGSGASAPSAGGGFSAPVDISGKLDKSVWNSAFELHYDDPDDPEKLTSIGAKTNFFSVGEISVFGKGGSSGSGGGATTLHMLEDVDLVMPIPDGDVLTYDGQKGRWTNKKGAGGIDTRAMWEELGKSDISKKIDISHIPDLGDKYISLIKLGEVSYGPDKGVISLPAYPTKLSDLKDDVIAGKYLPLTGGTISGNLAVTGHVQIGNALLKYDATNNAVYVEKDDGSMVNFYATGDLAAFGSTTGSGSGATSLGMLDDVDLVTPLSEGQVLTYDSVKSKWTNKKGGGGLDIDAMWEELAKSDTSKRIHFSHIPDLGSVYAKQVKLGTTPYNVSNGVVSLPAYPTALRSPNALTISLNGKSQGGYDGSSAKSINITPSSIGAALSSDLSKYVLKSGDTITGNLAVNGEIDCNVIGENVNDAHDGDSPWYGIRFTGGASGMDISGYYGIGFYTSNGRMIYLGNSQSHIVNLYAEGNANTDSSFVSSMTDRWQLQWPIYFNPDNAVFRANQLSLMMHDSCRPIISWKDTLDGVGWQTRYTIGTYRPNYDTWGTMLIAVSNDDGGNSPGIRLELEASNNRAVVQGSFLASGEITAYSDARLKSSIKPLRNRGSITPVSYIKDGKESIGFIAQDMIELYPELVSKGSSKEHYLSVNYAQYTAVLQAQIIELHKEIDDLKRKFIN